MVEKVFVGKSLNLLKPVLSSVLFYDYSNILSV